MDKKGPKRPSRASCPRWFSGPTDARHSCLAWMRARWRRNPHTQVIEVNYVEKRMVGLLGRIQRKCSPLRHVSISVTYWQNGEQS